MCGRYSLTSPEDAMRLLFDLPAGVTGAWAQPRFNIAPSQIAPVVRQGSDSGGQELVGMIWGLLPGWSRGPDGGAGQINARCETAAEKPTFRAAYRQRRCLVPSDGFYEWQKIEGGKQPYWISRIDGEPFVFAGLWETWSDGQGAETVSFTILTTAAALALRPIHHRMPVILRKQDHADWLDPNTMPSPELFAPEQAPRLRARPVSHRVNSPRNDDAACLQPARIIPAQGSLF
ncbi:MAG: SOS response-associated peptidase [Alphaproteobacteria bacterium]|nr:SOS response-associated peptidase [Alphaproteobacteria bacterium]